MEIETCNKHDECMGRIHDNIKKIEIGNATTQGKIDGFIISVNTFIESIRKDIYEKDGIMQRVGSQGNQIILQWGLMAVIVAAIIIDMLKK